jgi:hypothetical protein
MFKINLWNTQTEKLFFEQALKNFASPEQLFYKLDAGYFAYVPKRVDGHGQTLQSRNSLIGQFTEKWAKDVFAPIAQAMNLHAVNGVICEEVGLTRQSNADLAFCTTNEIKQIPENIKLLFEVKMSIVSNYRFSEPVALEYIGDYKTHKGNPSLLRSDSMLKAIGKAINIRVSGSNSSTIPIIILGNSPITDSYSNKVDYLKNAGVIQGFWSLNPSPTESTHLTTSPEHAFVTIDNDESLHKLTKTLVDQKMNYFSSMLSKHELGQFIRIANEEPTDVLKADKFIKLLREI